MAMDTRQAVDILQEVTDTRREVTHLNMFITDHPEEAIRQAGTEISGAIHQEGLAAILQEGTEISEAIRQEGTDTELVKE